MTILHRAISRLLYVERRPIIGAPHIVIREARLKRLTRVWRRRRVVVEYHLHVGGHSDGG